MKSARYALLALLLALPALAAAPPTKKATVPLVIAGDTAVIVKSLPCTVTAPAGADLYFWTLPDGVTGSTEDNVLTVTAAPAGESTIAVLTVTISITVGKDGAVAKATTKASGSVVLTNGSKPPIPPVPADPFTATLQIAYDADRDADRAKSLAFLQAVYKGLPDAAQKRPDLKTNADFVAWMKSAVAAPGVGLTPDKLGSLRAAIGADLAAKWGTKAAPLSSSDATTELTRIATALAGVK